MTDDKSRVTLVAKYVPFNGMNSFHVRLNKYQLEYRYLLRFYQCEKYTSNSDLTFWAFSLWLVSPPKSKAWKFKDLIMHLHVLHQVKYYWFAMELCSCCLIAKTLLRGKGILSDIHGKRPKLSMPLNVLWYSIKLIDGERYQANTVSEK